MLHYEAVWQYLPFCCPGPDDQTANIWDQILHNQHSDVLTNTLTHVPERATSLPCCVLGTALCWLHSVCALRLWLYRPTGPCMAYHHTIGLQTLCQIWILRCLAWLRSKSNWFRANRAAITLRGITLPRSFPVPVTTNYVAFSNLNVASVATLVAVPLSILAGVIVRVNITHCNDLVLHIATSLCGHCLHDHGAPP